MSHWKSFGLALLAAFCLLGETARLAAAACNLSQGCATEWSGGSVTLLGGLPVFSAATSINNAGQAVGASDGYRRAKAGNATARVLGRRFWLGCLLVPAS